MATLSGTVIDADGNPAARLVRVYGRSSGLMIGQTLSNASTGAWSMTVPAGIELFAVAHDSTTDANYQYLKLSMNFGQGVGTTVVVDDMGNTFTNNGTPTISSTELVSGFGNSLYFDGASSADVVTAAGGKFTVGTQDFCVRMKARFAAFGSYPFLFDTRGAGSFNTSFGFYNDGGSRISFFAAGSVRITGPSLSTGVTYDLEVSRVSSVTRYFVDGVQQGSDYADTNNYAGDANRPRIGGYGYNGSGIINAYVDDLEFYIGCGLHTANFTPSTTPHVAGPSGGVNAIVYDKLVGV